MAPHSCEHCQTVLVNPLFTVGGTQHTRLHKTPQEARQAAKDGCLLFRHLVKGYLKAFSDEHIRDYTRMLYSHFTIDANRDWGDDFIASIVSQLAVNVSRRPFQLRFDPYGWRKFTATFLIMRWASAPVFYISTAAGTSHTFFSEVGKAMFSPLRFFLSSVPL